MRRLIFIVGLEGSGTTMMSTLLGGMPSVEVLLGNFNSLANRQDFTPGDYRQTVSAMNRINAATKAMWDRQADFAYVSEAQRSFVEQVTTLLETSELGDVRHIVLKRSAPFLPGDRHRPDLLEIADLLPDAKILVMIREPCASTYSAHRRGFVDNLRHGAVICEEQLLQINNKLKVLDASRVCLLRYEQFCSRTSENLQRLAEFFDLSLEELTASLSLHPVKPAQNDLWRTELSRVQQEYLQNYFSPQRLAQFDICV